MPGEGEGEGEPQQMDVDSKQVYCGNRHSGNTEKSIGKGGKSKKQKLGVLKVVANPRIRQSPKLQSKTKNKTIAKLSSVADNVDSGKAAEGDVDNEVNSDLVSEVIPTCDPSTKAITHNFFYWRI